MSELGSVIAQMPEECVVIFFFFFFFLVFGKRKTSSFLRGREINRGKSERSSSFYIKNEREILFEQASSKTQR